uniref:Uncharacterized protein n=1 Tax=Glossina austeni TaxID=7395 RepID=A0A1A9VG84_GLOAU
MVLKELIEEIPQVELIEELIEEIPQVGVRDELIEELTDEITGKQTPINAQSGTIYSFDTSSITSSNIYEEPSTSARASRKCIQPKIQKYKEVQIFSVSRPTTWMRVREWEGPAVQDDNMFRST